MRSLCTYQHIMTPYSRGAGVALENSGPPQEWTDWVNRDLADQFEKGKPPEFQSGANALPNLANTTLDVSQIE